MDPEGRAERVSWLSRERESKPATDPLPTPPLLQAAVSKVLMANGDEDPEALDLACIAFEALVAASRGKTDADEDALSQAIEALERGFLHTCLLHVPT